MRRGCDGQPARARIASGVYRGEVLGDMVRRGDSDMGLEIGAENK